MENRGSRQWGPGAEGENHGAFPAAREGEAGRAAAGGPGRIAGGIRAGGFLGKFRFAASFTRIPTTADASPRQDRARRPPPWTSPPACERGPGAPGAGEGRPGRTGARRDGRTGEAAAPAGSAPSASGSRSSLARPSARSLAAAAQRLPRSVSPRAPRLLPSVAPGSSSQSPEEAAATAAAAAWLSRSSGLRAELGRPGRRGRGAAGGRMSAAEEEGVGWGGVGCREAERHPAALSEERFQRLRANQTQRGESPQLPVCGAPGHRSRPAPAAYSPASPSVAGPSRPCLSSLHFYLSSLTSRYQ